MLHRTELLIGTQAVERLARTRVILFGVGGVGSWCAESLLRSGIGRLTLVDSDQICVTNLNRQVQTTAANIGEPKAEALRQRLLTIRPDAQIAVHQTIYDARSREQFGLDDYHYVLDAIDSLSPKLDLIQTAHSARPTLYSSMGASSKLDPTRIKVGSIWKSDRCPLARLVRKRLRRYGFKGDFLCVYSDEPIHPPHKTDVLCGTAQCYCPKAQGNTNSAPDDAEAPHEWCSSKAQINGSIMHITAAFGLFLAGLVIQDVARPG